MKKYYDFIYLTNTPSFYKVNLCREIGKQYSILLVLYGYGQEAVNTTLDDNGSTHFDHIFLNTGDAGVRNKWTVFIKLINLMRHVECRKILYSGWFAIEYNIFAFLSPKEKNVMICESSIFDVSLAGFKGLIKRCIINRMGAALPSGIPHKQLFDKIGFKGALNITGSVGIFNKGKREFAYKTQGELKYIYVGRLVDAKNVSLLIDVFNRNKKPLTIVGQGPLEKELKHKAGNNIRFIGFIENEKLGAVYKEHDVFILPSKYEPWGLVVEEALYWGLPVIVSNKVGSSIDMVEKLGTGIIFESENENSLHSSIVQMEQNLNQYRLNVEKINWEERDKEQIKAYTSLLSK